MATTSGEKRRVRGARRNSRHEVSQNHTHRQAQDLLYQLAHDVAHSPDVRFDFIHPDDVAKVLKAFTNLVRNPGAARDPQSVRFRSRHKDGSWRTLEAVGTNLLDNPTLAGIAINSREITARKQAEDVLQQEHNFASTILNTVGALVVVLDQQGCIVRFNRACEQITGYSFAEVQGKPFWDLLLTPEEREPVRAGFKKLRASEFPTRHENYWVAKDGTRRLIAWLNTVLLDEAGAVTHVIATGLDITARKHAEALLKEEGEVTAALARVGQEMISSLDTPVILERLCRLTAEVLECDYSHTLLWQPTPALPLLHTDPVKLKMVLKNLITNALKFTEEGVITVAALPQGSGIEFHVSDTGIGIAPEALPIIFEPFRQVDSSPMRRHGGVRLGLYFVRQLLNLLGGTVSVESMLGKGSIFRVWLPLHPRQ